MLKRSLVLLFLVVSSFACKQTRIEEVKRFRIYVSTESAVLKNAVKTLVNDYNRQAGFEALSIVETQAESTSLIHFRRGLIEDGRKLGLGQWTAMQKQKTGGTFRQEKKMTIEYGMDIVFDQDNFLSKAALINNPKSDAYKHLFHLFCHEVGHGMQMDHDVEHQSSVMFPSIPEQGARDVDYNAYFQLIRGYLSQPNAQALAQHEHTEVPKAAGLTATVSP